MTILPLSTDKLSQPIIDYIGRNLAKIDKDARLVGKQYRYGGRFKYGERVSRGTVVVYDDKAFVAVSDTDEVPHVGHASYGMLVHLRHMRVTDEGQDKWFDLSLPMPTVDRTSKETALVSSILRHVVKRRFEQVLYEPIAGMHRWRGLFRYGKAYRDGDIVAYNHGMWLATPGTGVPGTKDGWSLLDYVSVGTAETAGESPIPIVFHAATYNPPA